MIRRNQGQSYSTVSRLEAPMSGTDDTGHVTRRGFINDTIAVTTATTVAGLIPFSYSEAQTDRSCAAIYTSGRTQPLTVDTTVDTLLVWVQSRGAPYEFRIASIDYSSAARGQVVFSGTAGTTISAKVNRGIWNAYASFSTAGWRDGLYAVDVAPAGQLPGIHTHVVSTMFIVRRGLSPSRILYRLPTNTRKADSAVLTAACNSETTDRSSYENKLVNNMNGIVQSVSIPRYRPGIGICIDKVQPSAGASDTSGCMDSPSTFNPSVLPRLSTDLHEGHLPLLAWLTSYFGSVDLCTDLDLHRADAQSLLSQYRLLIKSERNGPGPLRWTVVS